jgi:hypothetical protein
LSGAMKPKPLPSLNHFTVPVSVAISISFQVKRRHMPTPCRDAKKFTCWKSTEPPALRRPS